MSNRLVEIALFSESASDSEEDNDANITVEMLFPSTAIVPERWIVKQHPTEDEIPWRWSMRASSALDDARTKYESKPIMFAVTSEFTSQVSWYVWYPPIGDELLALDILKTLMITRASTTRYCDNHYQQHRELVRALIQVLASPAGVGVDNNNDIEYIESCNLLKYYFNTIELGRINHLYFYETDDHFDNSVYSESLDNNLAMYNWMC
jgi:hypothetical protein